jgi:predicted transcriptional regulator
MAAEMAFAIHTFHPDRPGIRKVLGDLEAEIMETIWVRPAGQGVTVRDIFEILYERRKTAYTTVMNTMTRLAKKRLLRVEKEKDLAYVYYPTSTEHEFIAYIVGHILADLLVDFSGAALDTLQTLSDQKTATQARLLLQEITQQREEEE